MAERPGIMFYFDILNELEDFSSEEVGKLFLAAMRYGMTGDTPEFSDRGMKALWHTIAKSVDRDAVKFDKKILQRQYAGWKSAQKKAEAKEEDLPSFEEWKANFLRENAPTVVNDRQRPLTTVNESQRNQPTVNSQQSTVSCQLSTVNNQLSTVSCHPSSEREMQEGEPELSAMLKSFQKDWLKAKESGEPETAAAIRKDILKLGYDIDHNGNIRKSTKKRMDGRDYEKDEQFKSFWKIYPKKTGDIRQAYNEYLYAIQRGTPPDVIIKAAHDQFDSISEEDSQFQTSAERWLRNRGWEAPSRKEKGKETGKTPESRWGLSEYKYDI